MKDESVHSDQAHGVTAVAPPAAPPSGARDLFRRMLARVGLYPHIFLTAMPMKIYEFRHLLKEVRFNPQDVVLDIGCGNGLQTLLLAKRCGEVVGLDVNPVSLDHARRKAACLGRRIRTQWRCCSLEQAGFAEGSFDKIFSICVLEHIPNHEEVLREAYRVLKPGGQIIFSVDALETIDDPEAKALHREKYFVQKYYTANELRTLLRQTGFRKITVQPLFRSAFVQRLFLQGIPNDFRFGFIHAVLLYYWLIVVEKRSHGDKGLFLVAHAEK